MLYVYKCYISMKLVNSTSMPQRQHTLPSPKRLVLSLLSAHDLDQVEISRLLQWGSLFDIDAAAMRVTVGRLTRQGLLRSPQRGLYCIGPEGELITQTARDWVNAEQRIGPWHGEWIMVHTSHLGRSNKTALRARERAFRLNGLAEFVAGLWCRPANFNESLPATRARLLSLGLEAEAVIIRAADMPGTGEKELFALWPREHLEDSYHRHIRSMEKSLSGLGKLSLSRAALETMLIGEAVIRQINADPLLPDPMVDSRSRRRMIALMKRYDRSGRKVWLEFMGSTP